MVDTLSTCTRIILNTASLQKNFGLPLTKDSFKKTGYMLKTESISTNNRYQSKNRLELGFVYLKDLIYTNLKKFRIRKKY